MLPLLFREGLLMALLALAMVYILLYRVFTPPSTSSDIPPLLATVRPSQRIQSNESVFTGRVSDHFMGSCSCLPFLSVRPESPSFTSIFLDASHGFLYRFIPPYQNLLGLPTLERWKGETKVENQIQMAIYQSTRGYNKGGD